MFLHQHSLTLAWNGYWAELLTLASPRAILPTRFETTPVAEPRGTTEEVVIRESRQICRGEPEAARGLAWRLVTRDTR